MVTRARANTARIADISSRRLVLTEFFFPFADVLIALSCKKKLQRANILLLLSQVFSESSNHCGLRHEDAAGVAGSAEGMRRGAVYADVAEGGENINYFPQASKHPAPFRWNRLLAGFGCGEGVISCNSSSVKASATALTVVVEHWSYKVEHWS